MKESKPLLLSILICTIPSRKHFLARLRTILNDQVIPWFEEVEILIDGREHESIGAKRNALLDRAKGKYLCFCDDDDRVVRDYISLLMEGIEKDVDCCSLTGIITENSKNPKTFIHSLQYTDWFEKDGRYFRSPNHLNCIRSSIAKQMRFPETNHGEDRDYSQQLLDSGLLKTEHWIQQPIYFYEYISPENRKVMNYH